MKYRKLGRTNLRVSVIGVGTWQLGGEWGKDFSQDEVDRMLRCAGELGINFIDTAECYGDHTSERMIGGAIHRQRDRWILATKFGHKFHSYMNRTDERSPEQVVQQFEESLRALRTDYVDIWQYHSLPDSEFDNDDLQKAVIKMKEQGKVRFIGDSIPMTIDPRHQVDAADKAHVDVLQLIYNRLQRRAEEYALPAAERTNIGVLARVPLASGLLSGKYKKGAQFTETDYRSGKKREELDSMLDEVEKIRRSEVPGGVDMATWALAWCLQHPAVSCVIPGVKSVEQVESNARAAELDMVRDDHPQAV